MMKESGGSKDNLSIKIKEKNNLVANVMNQIELQRHSQSYEEKGTRILRELSTFTQPNCN